MTCNTYDFSKLTPLLYFSLDLSHQGTTMKKHIRITIGSVLAALGIIFFIIPGSMFVLLIGLMTLSYDIPKAREWLRWCQNAMTKSARKLDAFLLNRKFKG